MVVTSAVTWPRLKVEQEKEKEKEKDEGPVLGSWFVPDKVFSSFSSLFLATHTPGRFPSGWHNPSKIRNNQQVWMDNSNSSDI